MSMYSKRNRFIRLAILLIFLILLVGSLVNLARDESDRSPYLSSIPEKTTSESNAAPLSTSNKKIKIVIDPGHGGKDPGAVGKYGKMEKDYTLSLSLKVYALLQKEPLFESKLTRTTDTFVNLEDRANMANTWNADALVSIHGNTYKDASVGGTETYYRYENGLNLAESIHQQVVQKMGFRDREVREDHLKVLSYSNMPATLLEIGYLTNPEEEAEMLSADGQARTAQAIVDGLKHYFTKLEGEWRRTKS